ncbi:MAG: chemotaxis protein CheR [Spirochaetaceae bacterium]|jgi:chemotaxis methyl-accepting protein methylase|nr:chemotaxis protein CheR [Spirochaetaceae bacterium]
MNSPSDAPKKPDASPSVPVPGEPADPVIKNLYRRVEQALGIRAAADTLEKLREYLEQRHGAGCFKTPGFYEQILRFPEDVFAAARFLTINETYFFRETVYFDLLRQEFLPYFARLDYPIRVCSAATSIGCEAYSLAMVMDDYSRTIRPFHFQIDAFDLNPDAVKTAKNGRYMANTLREDGGRWKFLLKRYTQAEGDGFVVAPGLRNRVHFYTHNILNGLLGHHYDLIFFRNTLIYFSGDKRQIILDHLADALLDMGILVLGISETPAVSHPLLKSQYAREAFYFQKIPEGMSAAVFFQADPVRDPAPEPSRPSLKKTMISPADPGGIAVLLDDHEGDQPIIRRLPELFRKAAEGTEPLSGDELFAAVIYLLGQEDFSKADILLAFIEKYDNSAFTLFLRGEYHYFNHRKKEAAANYTAAAGKNKAFWPAFYRICTLAAKENPVQYEYKTRKALESIDQGKEKRYELFIGGFSPDYYQRVLEKRLLSTRGPARK